MESRKMAQINLFAKQKQRHRQRKKKMYGHQGGQQEDGINWEIGINIYTLLILMHKMDN